MSFNIELAHAGEEVVLVVVPIFLIFWLAGWAKRRRRERLDKESKD